MLVVLRNWLFIWEMSRIAEGISPTELMKNPNPPHHDPDKLMHRGIDLNNLYYNNTDKVRKICYLSFGDWRSALETIIITCR